jgi:hypothetical protein
MDLYPHRQGLDTRTPAEKAMFRMMGVFAEFERAIIQERVRSGLAKWDSRGSTQSGETRTIGLGQISELAARLWSAGGQMDPLGSMSASPSEDSMEHLLVSHIGNSRRSAIHDNGARDKSKGDKRSCAPHDSVSGLGVHGSGSSTSPSRAAAEILVDIRGSYRLAFAPIAAGPRCCSQLSS